MTGQEQSGIVDDNAVTRLLRRLPSRLYKYTGLSGDRIEWMRRLIVDSELYFAAPSEFNDPLDCRIPPRFEASKLKTEQYWRRVAREHGLGEDEREQKRHIKKLLMDSKTPKGQERLIEAFFKSLDKRGIVSLSKDPKNMLMWSYYAEGHSGIVLRFNMSPGYLAAIPGQIMPVEVSYSHAFPDINYYDIETDTHQFFQMILGTKSNAWKHEEEWRLVWVEGNGHVRIPPGMIDGVILGMRIDTDSEQRVREWVSVRGVPTELLKVEHKKDSFDLQVVSA